MEETLSREEKRKLKKKQRKKQQRQQYALQQIQSIQRGEMEFPDVSTKEEELEEKDITQETKTELQIRLPKSLCEECKEKSVVFLCQDCGRYYCNSVKISFFQYF